MSGQKNGVLWTAGLLIPALPVALVFAVVLAPGQDASAACLPPDESVTVADPGGLSTGEVAGYQGQQLINAAYVLAAGEKLGMSARDQTIGVMTAMGESGLVNVDHGDAAGPDSRGLFQQRDNGAWGSSADRMDPFKAATSFFTVLQTIENRDSLSPTMAAHQVQRNADPDHYAAYWDAAVQIVTALGGTDTGNLEGTGDTVCTGMAIGTGPVNARGWALPNEGSLTSRFGPRTAPVAGLPNYHYGLDFGGACGSPIYAANDGVVTHAGGPHKGMSGNVIEIDHGGGVLTRYGHMYANGVLARTGDTVRGGQQIGRVGNAGNSTGCHVHVEITVNGRLTDPEAYLRSAGLELD